MFSAVLDLLGLGLRFLASMARFRANQEVDPEALTREYGEKLKAVMTLYGVEGLKGLFNGSAPALTYASVEHKRSDPEERKFDDLPMPMTARAEPTEPPKKFGFGFMPNDNVNNDTVSQLVNHQPIHNEMATRHESYERVSNETSGKAGKERIGKIDSCIECDDDYIVKSHHQIRCPECSTKAREQFVKTGLNR